jgi:iron-sulfur cluster assembly protein
MTVTENALKKLVQLQPDPSDVLIVSILGGGCAGYSYDLRWQHYKFPYDKQIIIGGVLDSIIVGTDKRSALFLDTVELDYEDGLNGKGFVWKNSASTRTCGCGSSFNV